MNEVVKQIAAKAGISEEQARKAVEAVADFAKSKFPAFSGQIDGLLKGGGGVGSGGGEGGGNPLADIAGKLGGLLGH